MVTGKQIYNEIANLRMRISIETRKQPQNTQLLKQLKEKLDEQQNTPYTQNPNPTPREEKEQTEPTI